jgi:hypothetical protein
MMDVMMDEQVRYVALTEQVPGAAVMAVAGYMCRSLVESQNAGEWTLLCLLQTARVGLSHVPVRGITMVTSYLGP